MKIKVIYIHKNAKAVLDRKDLTNINAKNRRGS
jgi:hypothetical protein